MASDHEMFVALARMLKHISILDDGHGRRHLIWTGPVRPGTGQPMLHRWKGKKNISAYRALWEARFGEEPYGRPRRLGECAHEMCIAPMCFTIATPIEPGALPEVFTRGQRIDHMGQPVANYKVRAPIRDRYYFRPESGRTVHKIQGTCGCKDCSITLPSCEEGHIIWKWRDSWAAHIGEQYRCENCSNIRRYVALQRSYQPRSGYRPVTAARMRFDKQVQDVVDSLPHDNTREQAVEDMRRRSMSDEEFADEALAELRAIEQRQDSELDDEGYRCAHISKLREGTMTPDDWLDHGNEEPDD